MCLPIWNRRQGHTNRRCGCSQTSTRWGCELRATDRLLAASFGATKSSQKAPNTQPRALSTGSAVSVLRVTWTKSQPDKEVDYNIILVVCAVFLRVLSLMCAADTTQRHPVLAAFLYWIPMYSSVIPYLSVTSDQKLLQTKNWPLFMPEVPQIAGV